MLTTEYRYKNAKSSRKAHITTKAKGDNKRAHSWTDRQFKVENHHKVTAKINHKESKQGKCRGTTSKNRHYVGRQTGNKRVKITKELELELLRN